MIEKKKIKKIFILNLVNIIKMEVKLGIKIIKHGGIGM